MPSQPIRIGTRGSPLALRQAEEVRDGLRAAHGLSADAVEIVVIKTSGDRIQDRKLREFGGKGLFTKEIEEALLNEDIEMAVHSMKDMPTELPGGLEIACLLPREDPRDAFVSLKYLRFTEMPAGATVGTASLRRQAQVKHMRPDLEVVTFRGNVQTRIKKLAAGEADATFLACAGLKRLDCADTITEVMDADTMLPAVAQGAICVEIRSGDDDMRRSLGPLHDPLTATCIAAERAFLAKLDGSCRTPIAGLASLAGDALTFTGEILSPDGTEVYRKSKTGKASEPEVLGVQIATDLLAEAGPNFLAEIM